MANLPEKNVVLVDKITNVPTDSNLFINANGEFKQASVNDVVNSSTVVSTAIETAINTAVQDSIDSHFKQATGSPILLTDTADGTLIDFKGKGRSTQKIKMIQGYYDSLAGTYATNANAVCNEKPIPCKTGDNIAITIDTASTIIALFYNGNTFVSASKFENATQATFTIPSNVDYYNFDIIKNSSITPNTVGSITITVNGSVAYPNPDYPQAIKSIADGGYFDGELLQGYYQASTGTFISSNVYVCNKNKIPCKEGDNVELTYGENVNLIGIYYWSEDGKYTNVTHYVNNGNKVVGTAPENTSYITFLVNNPNGITPQTAKPITVTINNQYALIVKSNGKNLLSINERDKATTYFNYTEYTNEIVKGSAIPTTNGAFLCSYSAYLEKGKTYTFSQESVNGMQLVGIYSDKLWGNGISTLFNVTVAPNYTHNADSGIYIIGYYGATTSGTEYSIVKPMLRRAEVTDGTYEPYKETVSYIPLNEPLRSSLDGSVSDVASLSEVTRRFAEVVLDGSDDEVIIAFGNDYPHLFRISVNGVKETRVNVICTHFLSHRKANSDYSKNMIYTFNDHIFINHMDITTVAEFKTWLQANPITVVYELAEPITESIEPVDIVTYDNVTYLTASDNAEMELEYPTSKVAGIASIGYSKGIKAEYETEQLKKQLLEIQATIVNTL